VVTEYAWAASTCDPCPGPNLGGNDFQLLGADVLEGSVASPSRYNGWDFVLTRLHARYGKDLTEDLVFKQAAPIVGGREFRSGGKLEERASPSSVNNFQARYAIRHWWTGPMQCANPIRGRWGGPPNGRQQLAMAGTGTAFAPRKANLPRMLITSAPEIGVRAYKRRKPKPKLAPAPAPRLGDHARQGPGGGDVAVPRGRLLDRWRRRAGRPGRGRPGGDRPSAPAAELTAHARRGSRSCSWPSRACGGERPAVVPPATRPSAPPPIEALLPRAPGPWSPSLVTIGPGRSATRRVVGRRRHLRDLPRRRHRAVAVEHPLLRVLRQPDLPRQHRGLPRPARQGREPALRRLPRPAARDRRRHARRDRRR
jgi:hypothetical protein